MKITAGLMHFQKLNELIRESQDTDIVVEQCTGQRYIASGLSGKNIQINGIAGNALGAYLADGTIRTSGNAQEATGDTMNDGTIIINGNCGDGTGYGMRGGKIFIRGNVGYRAGIHMKAYREKKPLLVVGGKAGSFLGEYQAGGTIIVLNMNEEKSIVGNFCGTGMHGGRMYLRCDKPPATISEKVDVRKAEEADFEELRGPIEEFCSYFGYDPKEVLDHTFYMLEADTKNPYRQLYTHN